MQHFWVHGYEATSMEDLVRVTGVGRGAIYSEFGGKRDLFLACLAHYQGTAVTPAFAIVEADGADLTAIKTFLNTGVSAIKEMGLPAPGCLMGNTLTELGAHDAEIASAVRAHYDRLTEGFACALANEVDRSSTDADIVELAGFLAVSAQGLWSYARVAKSIKDLKRKSETLIEVLQLKLISMRG